MAEQTSKAVSFSGDVPEKKSSKQPPTQKYDRKEIQKRLDIENWMDDELKRLYRDEVRALQHRTACVIQHVHVCVCKARLSLT
jgi:hypothetical protein